MSDYLGLPVTFPSRCTARCRRQLDWKFSGYEDEGATDKVAIFTVAPCARCGQRQDPQRVTVPLDWEPILAESSS